jgi:hypothetical protein
MVQRRGMLETTEWRQGMSDHDRQMQRRITAPEKPKTLGLQEKTHTYMRDLAGKQQVTSASPFIAHLPQYIIPQLLCLCSLLHHT